MKNERKESSWMGERDEKAKEGKVRGEGREKGQ